MTSANRKLALPEGPLGEACVAAFAGVLTHASAALAGAKNDPVTAVHEYRKSVRRARSLLRMLRPQLSTRVRRRIDVPLKEAHRSLSRARDRAILSETWTRLSRATGLEEQAIGRRLQPAAPAFALDGTRRRFDDLVSLLGERLEPDLSMADLGRGLRRTYRAARNELRRARTIADPVHVHALRRRCKDLNYQLEAIGSRLDKPRIRRTRKEFSQLARDLGHVTDLYQLRAAARAMEQPIEGAGAAINEAIEIALGEILAEAADVLRPRAKAWIAGLRLPD